MIDNISGDVQLFWANDENNEVAIIYDLKQEDRNKKYKCPVCGSEVKPVAIEYKTKDGNTAQVSPHFSHYDITKCNSETAIHWWFKNKILINGDKFIVEADNIVEYKCKDIQIEKVYETSFGYYKPDIVIITECGQTIFFEMNYTNKKNVEDYIDKWIELGNVVVEVDLKDLTESSFYKTIYKFKPLYYKGKCFNQNSGDLYYNTIGKMKEKLITQFNYSDIIKERLQKLNWFWTEVINYHQYKTNIEDIVLYIDNCVIEEQEIILKILKSKRCVNLYSEFIEYKVNLLYEYGNKYLMEYKCGQYSEYYKIFKDNFRNMSNNIKFNALSIKCLKYTQKQFLNKNISVISLTKELLKEYIEQMIDLYINEPAYYSQVMDICEFLKNTIDNHNLNLHIHNYNSTRSLQGLQIYNSDMKIKLDFLFFHNEIYLNNKYVSKININNKLDVYSIVESKISEYINIDIYKKFLEEEKNKRLKIISYNREKLNIFYNKLINIFDNNKDIIIEYNLNYKIGNLKNLLYFKDINNKEFIIYFDNLHLYDENKYNLDNNRNVLRTINNEEENKNLNYIELCDYLLNENDIYMVLKKQYEEYKIVPEDDLERYIDIKYEFENLFNEEVIFTFKNLNNAIYLSRYNFIKAIDELETVSRQIQEYLDNCLDEIIKNINKNKIIIDNIYFETDKKINNEIKRILYPLICRIDKTNIFRFNIDFTKETDKIQPWLIKDFIEVLAKFNITNIDNIK